MKNKRYFAKYISIEGKIKDGDRWSGVSNGKRFISPYKWNHTDDKDDLLDPEITDVKLVKLVLCDRDIQVGDEVTYLFSGEKRKVLSEKDVDKHLGKGIRNWCELEMAKDEKYHVKILGDISREAIWVKDGDEFDEEDIRFMISQHPPFEGWTDVLESFEDYIKAPLKIIQVKCTNCNHFH